MGIKPMTSLRRKAFIHLSFYLILSFVFSPVAEAQSSQEQIFKSRLTILKEYQRISSYQAPVRFSNDQRQNLKQSYQKGLDRLEELGEENKRILDPSCDRFSTFFFQVYQEIFDLMDPILSSSFVVADNFFLLDLSPQLKEDLLLYVRLRILFAHSRSLIYLLQKGAEGGYGLLGESSSRHSCIESHREEFVAETTQLNHIIQMFLAGIYGRPGLYEMSLIEQKLSGLISQKSYRNKIVMGTTIVGAVILSLIIWRFAPTLAAKLSPQIEQAMSQSKSISYMVRVTGLSIEASVYHQLDENYFFKEDSLLHRPGEYHDWDRTLSSIEGVLQAPLDSPSIYYSEIVNLHSREHQPSLVQVLVWQDSLAVAIQRWGSVEKAIEANERLLELSVKESEDLL